MVRRTCRAVLREEHEAHDAFQATFLVLVEQVRSLWVADSIGPWLHRVAYHAAVRAGLRRPGRDPPSNEPPSWHPERPNTLPGMTWPLSSRRRSIGCPNAIAPLSCCATWRSVRTRRPHATWAVPSGRSRADWPGEETASKSVWLNAGWPIARGCSRPDSGRQTRARVCRLRSAVAPFVRRSARRSPHPPG